MIASRAKYKEETLTEIETDVSGNITSKKETKKTIKITPNEEPDYIKIYTNVWSEINGVPIPWRALFLELATRMTYCNSNDSKDAQLVNTGKPYSESIKKALGWSADSMLHRGINELVKANAIRKINRGVYQVNPNYAGKGEWKYNPRLERGGVEKLRAAFSLSQAGIEFNADIVWADDGEESEINQIYREGLGSLNSTVLQFGKV